jgi:hypothetical protein
MEFDGILSVYCSIQFIYICIYIYSIYNIYINKYEVKVSRPSCRDRVLGPLGAMMIYDDLCDSGHGNMI